MGYSFWDEVRSINCCRFSFELQVKSCDVVVLGPTEHQEYVWASLEEVEQGKMGDLEIAIIDAPMRSPILSAFR